ncbi:hypothetical protein [Hymenobacter actinosclerus]|nr:hypothetical protein [Hymenobacter actinosclerus]
MLRHLSLLVLLAGLTTAATAQTTQPESQPLKPVPPAATADTVEGTYVAPGMTGAPKQQVTTDYSNRPLKKAAPAKTNSSTLSADEPRKAAPLRRP